MNKATTNSFLSIFWRAISFNPPRKNFTARKLLGIVSFVGGGGGEWGGGAGVIFGPRIFFLVSSGNRQVCADKTEW